MAGLQDPGAAENPLNDLPLLETGSILLKKWDLASLLVTLGEHGMILFRRGAEPYHTPTRAREVLDVSGAGDTAIVDALRARLGRGTRSHQVRPTTP